jgi:hypothetical protein
LGGPTLNPIAALTKKTEVIGCWFMFLPLLLLLLMMAGRCYNFLLLLMMTAPKETLGNATWRRTLVKLLLKI